MEEVAISGNVFKKNTWLFIYFMSFYLGQSFVFGLNSSCVFRVVAVEWVYFMFT